MRNAEKWRVLEETFWAEFCKMWPYIGSGTRKSIDHILGRFNYDVNRTDPEQLGPTELTHLFREYFRDNTFVVTLIETKNENFKDEKRKLESSGVHMSVHWHPYVDWMVITYRSEYEDFYGVANKTLGYDEEYLRTLKCFLNEKEYQLKIIDKIDEYRKREFEVFRGKWEPFIKKVREEANGILDNCLNELFHKRPMEELFLN